MTFQNSSQEHASLSSRQDTLATLGAVPDTLRRLVSDRTSEELRHPGSDGDVAIVEIVCLMQDWEEITGERIWRTIHEDAPKLEAFDDTLWSIEHDYASRDGHAAIEAFSLSRTKNVEMLANLDHEGWQRTVEIGGQSMTLATMIDQLVAADTTCMQRMVEAGH